jgi:hypothetical protein
MRIQYASDLHLEFSDNYSYLKRNPLKAVGDILVLAGDIGYLNDNSYIKHPFWDWASENYKQVIVAIGNHELYQYYDLANIPHGLVCSIRNNVKCYYNAVVRIENVDFIISTLWAKIPLDEAYLTEHYVNDFHRILYNAEPLTWDKFNCEHDNCFRFIRNEVAKSRSEHIIVVTHHVPSFQLASPDFAGSKINGAFTVVSAAFSCRLIYCLYQRLGDIYDVVTHSFKFGDKVEIIDTCQKVGLTFHLVHFLIS